MKNKSKKEEVVLCWGHILGPCFSDTVLYHIGSILSQMNFNWKLVLKNVIPLQGKILVLCLLKYQIFNSTYSLGLGVIN